MLNKENIYNHIRLARPLFKKLQDLYQGLPETLCQCDNPGNCCTTMPEMTMVEALQWLDILVKMPIDEKIECLQNFLAFYLTTPLQSPSCPFLMENSCSNYSFRPFACRTYGLWSKKIGRGRTIQNRNNRRETVKTWHQMGINIPEEKIISEMDYCDRVVQNNPGKADDKLLFSELEKIYKVSSAIPQLQKQFEIKFHSDFSYLVSGLQFPLRKILLGKLAVIREFHTKGTNFRLQKFLSKVTEESLYPAFIMKK